MNDLMNLPSLILERLEENELILVRGGEDPDDKAPNNGDGSCSGTNNGSGKCGGVNNFFREVWLIDRFFLV